MSERPRGLPDLRGRRTFVRGIAGRGLRTLLERPVRTALAAAVLVTAASHLFGPAAPALRGAGGVPPEIPPLRLDPSPELRRAPSAWRPPEREALAERPRRRDALGPRAQRRTLPEATVQAAVPPPMRAWPSASGPRPAGRPAPLHVARVELSRLRWGAPATPAPADLEPSRASTPAADALASDAPPSGDAQSGSPSPSPAPGRADLQPAAPLPSSVGPGAPVSGTGFAPPGPGPNRPPLAWPSAGGPGGRPIVAPHDDGRVGPWIALPSPGGDGRGPGVAPGGTGGDPGTPSIPHIPVADDALGPLGGPGGRIPDPGPFVEPAPHGPLFPASLPAPPTDGPARPGTPVVVADLKPWGPVVAGRPPTGAPLGLQRRAVVPEPGTALLLGIGLFGLGARSRRR